jgi:hypothetical protein
MKTWMKGDNINGFLISINEPEKDYKEGSIMEAVLKQLGAVKTKFSLTSLDSYEEEYVIGETQLRLESNCWDTVVISMDKDVIIAMKNILESMDS